MTRRLYLAIGLALLLAGSAAAFAAFDSHSHSASDTLRPFLLTVTPVWIAIALGARALRRR